MSFTQSDLQELDKAIASGVKKVKYSDREVEYRDTAQMLQARSVILQELNRGVIRGGTPEFCKGV